jgi:hypothetical protein
LKLAAIAAAVLALSAPALAAKTPAWTAQGVISRVNNDLVTVHGTTCRLTGAVGRQARQTFPVGAGAKIRCAKGVLTKIAVFRLPSVVVTAPASSPSTPPSVTVSGTITNVDGMTITIGALTCLIEAGSPDTSSLEDGTYLSSMRCTGNPLQLAAFTVG